MTSRRTIPIVDARIEIYTYQEIADQTRFSSAALRKMAQRMGIEQTVFLRSSYGKVSVGSKKIGVRKRNLGRLIKATAAAEGGSPVQNFEREMSLNLPSYQGRKVKRDPQLDPGTAAQLDELERKLGL